MPKHLQIGPYAQTKHSGRMFRRKTVRERSERDRIRITATGFRLEQDPRTVYLYLVALNSTMGSDTSNKMQ
jgi:hypothetical protein